MLQTDEFEQTQGESEGQGSLSCCSPWAAESDMSLLETTHTVGVYPAETHINTYSALFFKLIFIGQ